MNWTLEQVLALAPDPAVAKDARKLATPARWPSLGHDERSAWGLCQGSGKDPYQVKIDLSEPAFKCSCPSRKFPCKHGLALFMMLIGQADRLKDTTAPAWVTDWLEDRAARAEKRSQKEAAPAKPVDEAAKSKRADQRKAKVSAGLQELELWLFDLVRNGMANAQSQPSQFWETPALRLVDAQAPSLARRLREISGIPVSGQGWQDRLLAQISLISLLIDFYKRIDTLPPDLQETVRALIGWTVNQDEILAAPGERAQWQIIGQHVSQEDRLITRRSWLQTATSEPNSALVFEFSQVYQASVSGLVVGSTIDAEVCFFPGIYPQRAVIKGRPALLETSVPAANGYTSIQAALTVYAAALARNPWIDTFPVALTGAIPVPHSDGYALQDPEANLLPVHSGFSRYWELLAISGGHPIGVFGEWDGRRLLPFSAWSADHFIYFSEQ
jgi:hypothetical protein